MISSKEIKFRIIFVFDYTCFMQNILYLIFHIVVALGMFISFKLVNIKGLNKFQTLFINYIVAIVLSIFNTNYEVQDLLSNYSTRLVIPAVVIGFLFILNFILMLYSYQKVGMGFTTALNKMSVVIPVTVGILYLGQNSHLLLKLLGIISALIAFFLILYQKKSNVSMLSYILPIMVFIVSGTVDTSMELSGRYVISKPDERELFLLCIFFTALVFSIIFTVIDWAKNKAKTKFTIVTLGIGIFMGVFNYLASKMLLINVVRMGGSIVFPIHNASVVMLTALIGFFFFKEKFTTKQWIGIALAVTAVALTASTL